MILRYLCARQFDLKRVVKEIKINLEFRQSNIPLPILTDKTLNLLNKGMLYIHGRTKDLSPILVLDLCLLTELI